MRLRWTPVVAVVSAVVVSGCSSGGKSSASLEVRPVIMPAQHVTHVRSDPFAALHVPADENAFDSLSRSQQAALAEALRGVDCAHPPALSGSPDRVVCSRDSFAYLVGAPLFTAANVTHAAPIAPDRDVSYQWEIALTLDSAGADKAYQWTTQYHLDDPVGEFGAEQTSKKVPCGAAAGFPCSDFLAYISDGVVVTVPPTFDPVQTADLVTGDFNEVSAARLAREIAG
jgi:hypothetical protein